MASKKCMPLITNYKSDDSSLDGDADCDDIFNSLTENSPNNAIDEDDQPLSNFRHLHSSQNGFLKSLTVIQPSTNDSSIGSFKQQLNSPEDSILPNISDSEDSDSFSSSTDEEFKKLVDTCSSLPVTELLRSKQFTLMYSDKNCQKGKSDRIINIGYSQFFQEIQSSIKYEQPNASFHDICQLVDKRWNQLSKVEKKEYKKHSIVSMESQKMTSLSKCRSKLLNLLSEDNKQCCNPTCKNPVSYDPRWNGQYCSTKCVGEHCQLTFIDWCNNKRYDGKILNDNLYTLQRIPMISPSETNIISTKSPTYKNDNTVINTSINITTTTVTTTTTTTTNNNNNNNNNNGSMDNKGNASQYNKNNIIKYKKNLYLSQNHSLYQSFPLLLNNRKNDLQLEYPNQQYCFHDIKSIQNDHNKIKEMNNNPTSHYLEMNLCNNGIKEEDKNSVILRNQPLLLHNRIKAYSTCSPLDLILTSSYPLNELLSLKLLPNIKQSPISNQNIISNRDNTDIFVQLYFDKANVYSSSSSYPMDKQDSCIEPLSSLHYPCQASSSFTNSCCQSTSTRSHNSLFQNSNNNGYNSSNGMNTTYNSMNSSLSPMMITPSSSSSLFFNCGSSSSSNSSISYINSRPRTSSDVSNMRRSYYCHSNVNYLHHHLQHQQQQQPSTMTQNPFLHQFQHQSKRRQEHTTRPLSTIDYQTTQNIFSSLKLGGDLTSINELLPVNHSNIIDPITRPRAATTGSNLLLLNKQRLSTVLNHLKMNWFKKQSNIKKISQYNLTTTNKHNISSINDNTKKQNPDSFGSIRKTHLNQDNNDDEYVETFPMNINTFSNNLEHLTIQTNTFPNLSNHYMIL